MSDEQDARAAEAAYMVKRQQPFTDVRAAVRGIVTALHCHLRGHHWRDVRVIKDMDLRGFDAEGNPMFVTVDAEWQVKCKRCGVARTAPGAAGADRGADLNVSTLRETPKRLGGNPG